MQDNQTTQDSQESAHEANVAESGKLEDQTVHENNQEDKYQQIPTSTSTSQSNEESTAEQEQLANEIVHKSEQEVEETNAACEQQSDSIQKESSTVIENQTRDETSPQKQLHTAESGSGSDTPVQPEPTTDTAGESEYVISDHHSSRPDSTPIGTQINHDKENDERGETATLDQTLESESVPSFAMDEIDQPMRRFTEEKPKRSPSKQTVNVSADDGGHQRTPTIKSPNERSSMGHNQPADSSIVGTASPGSPPIDIESDHESPDARRRVEQDAVRSVAVMNAIVNSTTANTPQAVKDSTNQQVSPIIWQPNGSQPMMDESLSTSFAEAMELGYIEPVKPYQLTFQEQMEKRNLISELDLERRSWSLELKELEVLCKEDLTTYDKEQARIVSRVAINEKSAVMRSVNEVHIQLKNENQQLRQYVEMRDSGLDKWWDTVINEIRDRIDKVEEVTRAVDSEIQSNKLEISKLRLSANSAKFDMEEAHNKFVNEFEENRRSFIDLYTTHSEERDLWNKERIELINQWKTDIASLSKKAHETHKEIIDERESTKQQLNKELHTAIHETELRNSALKAKKNELNTTSNELVLRKQQYSKLLETILQETASAKLQAAANELVIEDLSCVFDITRTEDGRFASSTLSPTIAIDRARYKQAEFATQIMSKNAEVRRYHTENTQLRLQVVKDFEMKRKLEMEIEEARQLQQQQQQQQQQQSYTSVEQQQPDTSTNEEADNRTQDTLHSQSHDDGTPSNNKHQPTAQQSDNTYSMPSISKGRRSPGRRLSVSFALPSEEEMAQQSSNYPTNNEANYSSERVQATGQQHETSLTTDVVAPTVPMRPSAPAPRSLGSSFSSSPANVASDTAPKQYSTQQMRWSTNNTHYEPTPSSGGKEYELYQNNNHPIGKVNERVPTATPVPQPSRLLFLRTPPHPPTHYSSPSLTNRAMSSQWDSASDGNVTEIISKYLKN